MNRFMRLLRGQPSTTESTAVLWVKSLVSVLLFFGVFMVVLPSGPHHLFPQKVPLPTFLDTWAAGALFVFGVILLIMFGIATPSPRSIG